MVSSKTGDAILANHGSRRGNPLWLPDTIAYFYPECTISDKKFLASFSLILDINQQGEILFLAFLDSDDNEVVCPFISYDLFCASSKQLFKRCAVVSTSSPR